MKSNELTGRLRFGRGNLSVPVSLETAPGQLPTQQLRPGTEVGKRSSGEFEKIEAEAIEIEILEGRDGAKYAWKRVHPRPGGSGDSVDGGSTEAGFFALEMNGDSGVPEGTIVKAWYSSVGPYLIFSVAGGSKTIIRPTASVANSFGHWPAIIRINNGDGTWSDGDEVRLDFLHSDSALDRLFIENEEEEGFLNGTVTEDSDEFLLYWAKGHNQKTIEMCIDDVPTNFCWRIPRGWHLNEGDCPSTGNMNFGEEINSGLIGVL